MGNLSVGKRDVKPDAPAHTKGVNQGNATGNYEKQPGHLPDGRSTAESVEGTIDMPSPPAATKPAEGASDTRTGRLALVGAALLGSASGRLSHASQQRRWLQSPETAVLARVTLLARGMQHGGRLHGRLLSGCVCSCPTAPVATGVTCRSGGGSPRGGGTSGRAQAG